MKVLFTSFECLPFIKVGGLADVAGTLPKFIREKNIDIRVVLPLHKKIDRKKFKIKKILNKHFLIPIGKNLEKAEIWTTKYESVPVYFIENNKYYDREPIYGTSAGDYFDNSERFIFFNRAVLELCKSIEFKPDIIHCNDMQTGLIPAYLKTLYRIDAYFTNTKTIFTIHNIAYQGLYGQDIYFLAGFGWEDFTHDKFEYYGQINFMKAGIVYADKITTVSPTYAKEIQSSREFGRGMEGVLKSREKNIVGILNGIDYQEWNSEKDRYIKNNYSFKNIENKKLSKYDLQEYCNIKKSDEPLIGMVSRLDPLKGFDLLIEIIDELMKLPLQIVILGIGYKEYQDKLKELSLKFPEKLSLNLEFNNELAHKIYAGSDIFLMPSKTEPCGLGQLIAMKYGTIPIVHKTGGLADTVDSNCGFVFENYDSKQLLETIKKAIDKYNDPEVWKLYIKNCMKKNFSWEKSVKEYVSLYKSL